MHGFVNAFGLIRRLRSLNFSHWLRWMAVGLCLALCELCAASSDGGGLGYVRFDRSMFGGTGRPRGLGFLRVDPEYFLNEGFILAAWNYKAVSVNWRSMSWVSSE